MSKFSHIMSWCSVFTYLLLFPLQVTGAVVCVGDDGHVELEQSFSSFCCAPKNAPTSLYMEQELAPILVSSGCGSCTDKALTAETALRNSKPDTEQTSNRFQDKVDLSPPALTSDHLWNESLNVGSYPSKIHLSTASHLSLLRTVVLLR